MLDLWSNASRKVLFVARWEAGAAGCELIGSEHLLEGLVRVNPKNVDKTGAELSLDQIKQDAQRWHVDGKRIPTSVDMKISDEVGRICERAAEEARTANCSFLRTEHLLFALMNETGCNGAVILHEHGGTIERTWDLMLSVAGSKNQEEADLNPSWFDFGANG